MRSVLAQNEMSYEKGEENGLDRGVLGPNPPCSPNIGRSSARPPGSFYSARLGWLSWTSLFSNGPLSKIRTADEMPHGRH
jgi:hypothetical protein